MIGENLCFGRESFSETLSQLDTDQALKIRNFCVGFVIHHEPSLWKKGCVKQITSQSILDGYI